jgi:hypothetical protein
MEQNYYRFLRLSLCSFRNANVPRCLSKTFIDKKDQRTMLGMHQNQNFKTISFGFDLVLVLVVLLIVLVLMVLVLIWFWF